MSKDLNDQLHWLEEELLQKDWTDDGQEFNLDDILGEFSEDVPEDIPEEAPAQNRAVDFDRMAFGDEDFDESTAVLVTRKKTKEKSPQGESKKGIRALVFVAVLEVIAILALLLRWALWFL